MDHSFNAHLLSRYCEEPRTFEEIRTYLGVDPATAREAIHYHRLWLSNDSALVQRWLGAHYSVYVVTDDPALLREWVRGRTQDGETRVQTMHALAQVAVRVTDEGEIDHRKALRTVEHLRRLQHDWAWISEEISAV